MRTKTRWFGLLAASLFLGGGLAQSGSAQSLSGQLEGRIEGQQPGQRLGTTVTLVQDLNGDGEGDLVVGSPSYTPPDRDNPVWAAFVHFGGPQGIDGEADPDLVLYGDQAAGGAGSSSLSGQFGLTLASMGDADGDGCHHLGVGVADQENAAGDEVGAVYLYDLCADPETAPSPYATVWGAQPGGNFGYSLAAKGDELLIGALRHATGLAPGGAQEGAVFRLATGALQGEVQADRAASAVYRGGQDRGLFGYSVAFGPDITGDGGPDVLIGAPAHDRGGKVYLFPGEAGSDRLQAGDAFLTLVPNQDNAGMGVRVAGYRAGDATLGQGVLAGASIYDGPQGDKASQGAVFLFPLDADSYSPGQEVTPDNAITFLPDQAGAEMGSLGMVPDLDGGGRPEVVVGAPLFTNSAEDEGAAFLFLGEQLQPGQADLTPAAANAAYYGGQTGAQFGSSLGVGADTNGLGKSEVLVGARGYDGTEAENGGAAFLFHGEGKADLALEMVTRTTEGKVGETLRYGFQVVNKGENPVPGVTVRVPLDKNLLGHAADGSTDGCRVVASQAVHCELGEMEAGTREITVDLVALEQGEAEISATLQAEGTLDPDPANNSSDTVTATIAAGSVNTSPVSGGGSGTSSSSGSGSGCSLGGGGCTLKRDGFFDPLFPALLAGAALWLAFRRRELGGT